MSQQLSFTCTRCAERIEDPSTTTAYEGDCPIVIYMVAGLAPMHPMAKGGAQPVDVADFPMPQIIRDLLAQPIARRDWCPECFAEEFGLPMVDKDGKAVKAKKK